MKSMIIRIVVMIEVNFFNDLILLFYCVINMIVCFEVFEYRFSYSRIEREIKC
jgi:hypothetical protein